MRVGALQADCIRFVAQFRFLLLLVFAAPLAATAQQYQIQHEGRSYVDLATAGSRLGMKAYWLKGYKTFRLRSQWTNIDVGKGNRVLYLNRMPIYLGFPTLESRGRLYMAKADYQHVIQSVLTPQAFSGKPKLKRIILDAGHGGRDPGAVNKAYGISEKELALDVAKRLKRLLEQSGYEVLMTRSGDSTVPLSRRPLYANRERGDLFISIHFNAALNTSAEGFETFALTPQYQASSKFPKPAPRDNERFRGNDYDAWNTLVGYHIQSSLVKRTGEPDRGLKRARFVVLKGLDCPGVLVELGFISNPITAQKVRHAVFRQTLAQSLCDGIVTYGQRLQRIR